MINHIENKSFYNFGTLRSKKSKEEIENDFDHIKSVTTVQKTVDIVICGNKCDSVKEREVSEEEAKLQAHLMCSCHYFETSSASIGQNVDNAVDYLLNTTLCDVRPVSSVVVNLDSANFDSTIANAEIVFVNFHADWCRFSQMLTPIFEETSNKFTDSKKVVFGSVDCDRQTETAQKYHINKYPTLKLFRSGQLAKREYRGSRSVEALEQFIQQQLDQTLHEFSNLDELNAKLNTNKRNIIAYFTSKSGPEWENFRKVSANLREECDFFEGSGEQLQAQTLGGHNLAFRPPRTTGEDHQFTGNMADMTYLNQWVTDKCIPLVREITFENAEELTEEGLPFLILFRHPTDNAALDTFTAEVARQLDDQRTAVNFLYADGVKFAHPLHHLGKTERDLPLIAIDSFRHMYLFPDMKELTVQGKLRNFILDLHSGKLHREFHHGPDPAAPEPPGQQQDQQQIQTGDAQAPATGDAQPPGGEGHDHNSAQEVFGLPPAAKTSPPLSVFQKLKPSRTRYTLRDEL